MGEAGTITPLPRTYRNCECQQFAAPNILTLRVMTDYMQYQTKKKILVWTSPSLTLRGSPIDSENLPYKMTKFDRNDDYKFHPCIGFQWFFTTAKNKQPTPLKSQIFFGHIQGFVTPRKNYISIFLFEGKVIFFPILDSMLRF